MKYLYFLGFFVLGGLVRNELEFSRPFILKAHWLLTAGAGIRLTLQDGLIVQCFKESPEYTKEHQ